MLLLLGLVAFSDKGRFRLCLKATLLVLGLFLCSLVFKLLAPRPTSLSAQPLSCTLAPSITRVARPTFLTHFLVSMPDPALKLS